jgi:hypothetical protein
MQAGAEPSQQPVVTLASLEGLPEPVQRYFQFTGVVGHPWIRTVHLTQTGQFRQGLEQSWMPVSASQVFTCDPPGFVWNARFKIAGLPLMRAQDTYKDGHGHMFGHLAGLISIFDMRGEQIDQGSLLRYLGEMIWFPTAFLGENITWQAVDDQSAQVTLVDGELSVSGLLSVDEQGRPTQFSAQRYREVEGVFSLDPWTTPITEYGQFESLNLPVRGHVTWNLPDGDLTYFEWQLSGIKYNQPVKF